MTTSSRWAVTLLVCTFVVGSLTAFKVFQIRSAIAFAESFPEHSETVIPEYARKVSWQPTIDVLGDIVLPELITLRNELPGQITILHAQPGDQVTEGQPLIQLDISEELARKQSAEARLKLAKLNLRRMVDLRKNNNVSQSELDNASAELAVIQSELAVIKVNIAKKTLRAPFDGSLGIHHLQVGSLLQANTEIASFAGNQPWLWVEFSVPQFYPLLAESTRVEVRLSGHSGTSYSAEIMTRDQVITSSTRTHQYRARMNSRPQGLTQNASVTITLPVADAQSFLEVSLPAVQLDEGGAYIYQLTPDTQNGAFRARRQGVTVVQRKNDTILLATDLDLKIPLAATGAFKLQPGMLVYPSSENTPDAVVEYLDSLNQSNSINAGK